MNEEEFPMGTFTRWPVDLCPNPLLTKQTFCEADKSWGLGVFRHPNGTEYSLEILKPTGSRAFLLMPWAGHRLVSVSRLSSGQENPVQQKLVLTPSFLPSAHL